jgi:hypothetical protein
MASLLGFPVVGWGSPAIGTYLVPGTSVKLAVRKEIAPLLIGFARDFNEHVELLHPGWCWGFNPKHIAGSSAYSNHAWGGAIDLNAPAHPMGKANTFSSVKRAGIDKLLKQYSYKGTRLIRAGKDYTGRKDDMHFEINVSRSVALAAVAAMSTSAGVEAGSRTIQLGSRGADVKLMQSKIGAAADGIFGPGTEAKLKIWQKAHKLPADGVCGPKSWAALGVK